MEVENKNAVIIAVCIFVFLSFLDVYSTRLGIQSGGYEGNPFLRFMGLNLLPAIKILGIVIIGIIAVMCEKVQNGTAHLPFVSASVMTAFPVLSNFHNLYSQGVLS